MNETSDVPPTPSTPSIELLKKLELAIETVLTLIPQSVRICVHYIFRPGKFLEYAMSDTASYNVQPYTFLAITALTITFLALFGFALYEGIIDEMISAMTAWIGGGRTNEGYLRLARLIQVIRDRSFTSILFSTGATVVALAALSRALAHIASKPSSERKLERVLCYVAGGQQIHAMIVLLVQLLLFLFVAQGSISAMLALALPAVWLLLLPTVTISRAIRRLQLPAPGRIIQFGWGLLFCLLNIGTVAIAVYSVETVPAMLARWQDRLEPHSDRLDYVIPYSKITSNQREFILIMAIEIRTGRQLVIDKDDISVGQGGFLYSKGWSRPADMLDSSEGGVALVVIRPGQTKWIKLKFSLDDEALQSAVHDGELTGYVICGKESLSIQVAVARADRLNGTGGRE